MTRTISIAALLGAGIFVLLFLYGRGEEVVDKYHASMYYEGNKGFYEGSLQPFADTEAISPRPRLMIVNQHVLAASLIAHQFTLARDESVKRVVLVTQNNWSVGRSPVITSRFAWKTPLGEIQPDTRTVDMLVREGVAAVDESIFSHEHGITGVIPYVAHAFPNARVTTLVIRDGTKDADVDALVEALRRLGTRDTVYVATIDLSHYLPRAIADAHDRRTLDAVRGFEYEALPTLDIDTAPTLRAILRLAEEFGHMRFVENGHANSATIIGMPDISETTSYMTGHFEKGSKEESARPMHALFVGETAYSTEYLAHERAFARIERLFLGADAVIGGSREPIETLSVRGQSLCVVRHQGTDGSEARDAIRLHDDACTTVAVLADWGGAADQQALARGFVDAGADIVLGNARALGKLELYKGRPVFYSLGTLVSETAHASGVLVHAEFGPETRVTLVPVISGKGIVSFPEAPERDRILGLLVDKSLPEEVAESILTSGTFILSP